LRRQQAVVVPAAVVARRLALIVICALAAVPCARAATSTTVTAPVYNGAGQLVRTPFAPPPTAAKLTKVHALALVERDHKVAACLSRYPNKQGLQDEETFDPKTSTWLVKIWLGKAGQIVEATVDDQSGVVTEAWTGPQVAWKMARGYKGAFGGTKINEPWVWGIFCLVFLVGLGNFRKPFSLRNLDLIMLLSPTASLWYFNHGNVFAAVPLFYPALVWVVLRGLWIGFTGRGSPSRPM